MSLGKNIQTNFLNKKSVRTLIKLFKDRIEDYFEMTLSPESDYKSTIGQEKKMYFNRNYRREMKLIPIIMDYCLLQLDALKFFIGVRLHGGIST